MSTSGQGSLAALFASKDVEQDPRWAAVDEYTQSHLNHHEHLNVALRYAVEQGLPNIATYPVFSKMLAMQCLAGRVAHALEVGTLGGYTPIWLTTLNPKLKVTTLEVSEEHAAVARENLKRAGVDDRVEVIVGPALETLPKLLAEVEAGKREKIGLTYIDADKVNNVAYFDYAVKMSRPGAMVYIDNIVRAASIVDERYVKDPWVKGSRDVIEITGRDERVEAVVMQTVAEKSYDGFLCAVVK